MTDSLTISLWGNRYKTCPPAEERNIIKQEWSCEEYLEFNYVEATFQIITVVVKGYQIILYTAIFAILLRKRCKVKDSS